MERIVGTPFILRESIRPRVEALRARGVRFSQPGGYPPRGMDVHAHIVTHVESQVSFAELLANRVDPHLIEVERHSAGCDVDVAADLVVPVLCQIKDFNALTV